MSRNWFEDGSGAPRLEALKVLEILGFKVVRSGKKLAVVMEEYTTQCCGECGNLNKNMGGSKAYPREQCGFKRGMDENAARNIFLKYLKE